MKELSRGGNFSSTSKNVGNARERGNWNWIPESGNSLSGTSRIYALTLYHGMNARASRRVHSVHGRDRNRSEEDDDRERSRRENARVTYDDVRV